MKSGLITAGLLVIGDEILSGRTHDRNISSVAEFLTARGIDLCEVRIVRDQEVAIVEAVNAMRASYSAVITTGGIGPTHDDITAESLAAAFGVPLLQDPRAVAALKDRYGEDALTPARLRMARIPEGAELIANPISAAPGFTIDNVHVLAGVPPIMNEMLKQLAGRLGEDTPIGGRTISVPAGEGSYAASLAELQMRFPDVAIGSYPRMTPQGYRSDIVLRSRDGARLAEATSAVELMLGDLAIEIANDPDAAAAP